MLRKILCVLVTALVLCSFSACRGGDGQPTAEPQGGEPSRNPEKDIEVTLGLWGVSDGLEDQSTQWILEQIYQKFGVRFILVDISALGDNPMLIEQIELPQVITHPLYEDRFSYSQLLNMGLLRVIPQSLSDKYPNVKTAVARASAYIGLDKAQVYFIPRTSYAHETVDAGSTAIFYRTDWASQLGKPVDGSPSWEYFIELMRAYTYGDADKNGKADVWGMTTSGKHLGGVEDVFFTAFGVRDWVLEEGQWIPGYLSQRGKEALKWANSAYRMGYIDQEYGSMSVEDAISKFCAGRAGMLVMDATPYNVSLLESKWADLQPELALANAVALMPQPVSTYGVSYQDWDNFSGGTVFRHDVTNDVLDRVLQVMDWLYGVQGLTTAMYGQEGRDYTLNEHGLVTTLKDPQGRPVEFAGQNGAVRALAQLSTYARDGADPSWRTDFQEGALQVLRESYWKNSWASPMFSDYILSMATATYNPGGILEREVARMMITSADVDAQWDEFVEDMKELLVVEPVQREVNAFAQENGIVKEE